MAVKVNPGFIKEIQKYGAFDISACFNCGNCTAVCPLSTADSSFPRKLIRAGHLGMEDRIVSSVDPWLCYYCGECSDSCPRQAFPGEYMMTLRRYLIAKYDMTGISRILYKLGWLQPVLVVLVIALAFLAFNLYRGGFAALADKIELAFPIVIGVIIVGYIINMYRHVIVKPLKRPAISLKPKRILEIFYHGFTQIRFTGCTDTDWTRYIAHLLVMSGYVVTLMISFFHLLQPLNNHYGWFSANSIVIFYASLAIVAGGSIMMSRRVLKSAPSSSFSHSSDWVFVSMLFLVGLSTVLTLLLNLTQGPASPLLSLFYKLNVAIETAWIVLVVPFTKWVHIFFRPLAVYFHNIKRENATETPGA